MSSSAPVQAPPRASTTLPANATPTPQVRVEVGTTTPATSPATTEPPEAAPHQAADTTHLGRWVVLGLLMVTATAGLMTWWIGPAEVMAAVRGMSGGWLAVAVLLELGALAALTRVYVATFRVTSGVLPVREAATISLGSFGLSQLLPAGGAAGGVFATHRLTRRVDAVTAATTVVLAGATSLVTLGLLVTAGTGLGAMVNGGSRIVAAATGVGTLVLVATLLAAARAAADGPRRMRLVTALARRTRRDHTTRDAWLEALERQEDLLRNPARLLPAMGWSALSWSLDIAVLGTVSIAVGLDLPVLTVIAAYGVANLANAVPLTPGGIGLVEAGITGTLIAVGVDPGSAAVTALGYRLVGDLMPVAIAAPVVLSAWRATPTSDATTPTTPAATPAMAATG